MTWKQVKFSEVVESPPKVTLKKGERFSFIPMELVNPAQKYVVAINNKTFTGGGAKFGEGDTIFARITPCLENGKIAKVKGLEKGVGFGSTEYLVFRARKDLLDADFLYYLVISPQIREVAIKSMTGSSGRQRAKKEVIDELTISVPSYEKQVKIGAVLSTYDDLIENNRLRIQLLEQATRLIYEEWFIRFRFPGHEQTRFVDDLPKGWKIGIVSDLFRTGSGGTPSRKKSEYYNGGIKWVKTQELNNSYVIESNETISESGLKNSSAKLFPKNTVLLAMYGATIGELGILNQPMTSNQACCALTAKTNANYFIFIFLYLLFNKDKLVRQSKGSAQNNISQEVVKEFPLLIPSTEILDIFTHSLLPSFELIANLQVQNLKLKKARDLLLPKLMSGEIQV